MSCSFTTTWSLSAALSLFNGRRGGHPTTGQPRRPPFSVDLKLRLFFSFVRFDRSLSNNSLTIFSFVVLFTLLSLLPLFLVTGTRSDRRCRRHPVISSCVCLSFSVSLLLSSFFLLGTFRRATQTQHGHCLMFNGQPDRL